MKLSQRTILAICSTIAIVVCYTYSVKNRKTDAKPFGKFTKSEILKKSEPLCMALNEDGSPIKLIALKMAAQDTVRGISHFWVVDCLSDQDRFKAHLMWNADTGALLVASSNVCRTDDGGQKSVSKSQAKRIAGSWMSTLGLTALDTGWKCESAYHVGHVWRVTWEAQSHKTAVVIDARTTKLIVADSMLSSNSSTVDGAVEAMATHVFHVHRSVE